MKTSPLKPRLSDLFSKPRLRKFYWRGAALKAVALFCLSHSPVAIAQEREWSVMESGTTAHFNGRTSLAVYNSEFAVAVGTSQTVLVYDGTEWKPFPGAAEAYSSGGDWALPKGGVAVGSPEWVFLANYGDTSGTTTRRLFQWNGSTWKTDNRPTGGNARLTSIWAARTSQRVLVGTLEGVYASNSGGGGLNGTGWSKVSSAQSLQIKSISDSVIFSLDGGAKAIHFSTDGGANFTGIIDNVPESAYAFAPVAEDSIWVVGEGGEIWHWDGSIFQAQESPTLQKLNNVFAFSSTDIWAVGQANTLLHFDGSTWSQQLLELDGQYSLFDIAGDELGNLYIVGSNGLILHSRAIPEPRVVAFALPVAALLLVGRRFQPSRRETRSLQ